MRSVPLHLIKSLREGRAIAAKLKPKFPNAAAWVWVAPYQEDGDRLRPQELKNKPWRYAVHYFEVPLHLVENEYDVSDEELLHNERYEDIETLAEVDDLLERLVGDPSKFKLLSDFDDPFPF